MTEKQDGYDRTSIIDSLTGDTWTYQQGAGIPAELPVDRHGSPTEAAFDAMPTDPSALRALLLTQAKQQQAQATAEEKRIMAERGKKAAVPTPVNLSDDDYVFDQATTMLWNPLVSPALRSALYKVLAETPGVQVRTGARDSLGRPPWRSAGTKARPASMRRRSRISVPAPCWKRPSSTAATPPRAPTCTCR